MTTDDDTALLKLALNGTALELLACIEAQAERVDNGFLEARRYRLSEALDSIEAWLTVPSGRGSLVLAAAGIELGKWRAYQQSADKASPIN
jgi:hypothetical protein